MVGSIEHLAEQVEKDLEQALPQQRKTQRKKLALLVSTMIQTRSANTMDLAAALPIGTERIDYAIPIVLGFAIYATTPGAAKTKELFESTKAFYEGVLLTKDQVRTNIAVIHGKGHKEPWIIAMKQKPGSYAMLST